MIGLEPFMEYGTLLLVATAFSIVTSPEQTR